MKGNTGVWEGHIHMAQWGTGDQYPHSGGRESNLVMVAHLSKNNNNNRSWEVSRRRIHRQIIQ